MLLGGAAMLSAGALAKPLRDTVAPLCAIDTHVFGTGKLDDWEHQFVRLRKLIAVALGAPRERFRDRSGSPRPWRVIDHHPAVPSTVQVTVKLFVS